MNRRMVIPLGLLAMAALVAGAFAWDCIRIDRRLRRKAESADESRMAQEARLVQAVSGLSTGSAEIEQAVRRHAAAKDREERETAYAELRAAAERALGGLTDPTRPADRRLADEIHGAINRRDVADRDYQTEADDLRQWRNSLRGRVASIFVK